MQAISLGGAIVSWWDYGRASLGIYLALNAAAVLELARQMWLHNKIRDRRD